MVRTNASETYTYDRLDQLKTLWRGSHYKSWNYDPTGNWISHVKHGTVQNRTHNAANEILNTVTHDANGNMTSIPDLAALKYDAWNRLVAVGNNISYSYDGLNRRIKKTVGNAVTRSFFNANWQEVESRKGNAATTYVWGLRYVDDLVSRQRGVEKVYALQDANWNVVAISDIDGVVLERYTYDGFGKRNALLNSGIDFDRGFTGQVLDAETGLMLYRNRYYSTSLGRFINRDPVGYDAGDMNLYRYLFNMPLDGLDPYGLQAFVPQDNCVYGCHGSGNGYRVSNDLLQGGHRVAVGATGAIFRVYPNGGGYWVRIDSSPNPYQTGFTPRNINGNVSPARHAAGFTQGSQYISVSSIFPGGSPNHDGTAYAIDKTAYVKSGGEVIPTKEILRDIRNLNLSDGQKSTLYNTVKSVEGEVLLHGDVPAGAVKPIQVAKLATVARTGGKALGVVGVAGTTLNMAGATCESVQEGTVAPVAAQGVREIGTWGGAWGGAKGGAIIGSFFCPGWGTAIGAVIGGIGGGIAGGYAGDKVGDCIHEN